MGILREFPGIPGDPSGIPKKILLDSWELQEFPGIVFGAHKVESVDFPETLCGDRKADFQKSPEILFGDHKG